MSMGFRAEGGCVDQIFTVRQIVEITIEKYKKMYVCGIHGPRKAYDNAMEGVGEYAWIALSSFPCTP